MELLEKIEEQVKQGSELSTPTKYLIIAVFAGHSVDESGGRCLLLNEYDEESFFYRKFEAQKCLNNLASKYLNTYIFGIFATQNHVHDNA